MPFAAMSAVSTTSTISRRNRFLFQMNPRWPKKSCVLPSSETLDLSVIHQNDQVDRERDTVLTLIVHQDLGG